MARKLQLLGIFCLFFIACKKQAPSSNYVPGMVLAGLKANVPINTAFSIVNNLNISIQEINGYDFKSPYSRDSVVSLNKYLGTKKYIEFGGAEFMVQGYTAILCTYQNMDSAAQADWINTIQQLQLSEVIPATDTMKDMFLTVPVGQEQAYMNLLSKNPNISWVSLNNIEHIQL